MLKQVLAVAVVGLLAAGSASAHDWSSGYRYAPPAYQYYPYYAYPRYAPIRYAPRYCPPPRWGWQGGYYGQYPRGYQGNSWRGRDDHDDHDRNDHGGWNDHGGGNDWDRHH
jgi:hypothetical protein